MKKPSDHIFQLIHAMSPAEKRYFRLHYASEASQLTLLFDEISRLKTYDEAHLKLRLEPTVARNIKVYKVQLQDLLLKSLTSFHSKRSVLSKVRMWLEEADILADKRLFELALDRLSKARGISRQYEEFTYLLEISAREFYLKHVSNDRVGISTHPYFEETVEFIRHIQTALNYHKQATEWLDYLAYSFYRRATEEEIQKAQRLLASEALIEEKGLSFRAKLSRNTLLMSLYRLLHESSQEDATRRANVGLFQEFPQFQKSMPFQYIAVLRNLMNFALERKDYQTAQDCIDSGITVIQANPTFGSQLVYFHYGLLEMNFECRRWQETLQEWEQPVMQNLKQQGIARERIAMLCYVYFIVIYQILNKPSRVQHYLRKALECREEVRTYFKELLILLDLISHHEAGDYFLVAKQVRAIRKKQQEGAVAYSELLNGILDVLSTKQVEKRAGLASGLLEQMPHWEASALGWMVKSKGLYHWLHAVAAGKAFSLYMLDNY